MIFSPDSSFLLKLIPKINNVAPHSYSIWQENTVKWLKSLGSPCPHTIFGSSKVPANGGNATFLITVFCGSKPDTKTMLCLGWSVTNASCTTNPRLLLDSTCAATMRSCLIPTLTRLQSSIKQRRLTGLYNVEHNSFHMALLHSISPCVKTRMSQAPYIYSVLDAVQGYNNLKLTSWPMGNQVPQT